MSALKNRPARLRRPPVPRSPRSSRSCRGREAGPEEHGRLRPRDGARDERRSGPTAILEDGSGKTISGQIAGGRELRFVLPDLKAGQRCDLQR